MSCYDMEDQINQVDPSDPMYDLDGRIEFDLTDTDIPDGEWDMLEEWLVEVENYGPCDTARLAIQKAIKIGFGESDGSAEDAMKLWKFAQRRAIAMGFVGDESLADTCRKMANRSAWTLEEERKAASANGG